MPLTGKAGPRMGGGPEKPKSLLPRMRLPSSVDGKVRAALGSVKVNQPLFFAF